MAEMVVKIRLAADAWQSPDFLIVARTDARDAVGPGEAIARGRAYADAGPEVIFIEASRSEAEMRRIAAEIPARLVANLVEGGSSPILDTASLKEIGYGLSIHPVAPFLVAASAMQQAYAGLRDRRTVPDGTEVFDFGEFSRLMGCEEVWAFAERYSES